MRTYEHYDEEEEYDCIPGLDYPYDTHEEDRDPFVLNCGLPGCVMPGYHFLSECHTAEMIEAQYAAAEREAQAH